MRVVTDAGAMRAAMLPTLTATSMRVAAAGATSARSACPVGATGDLKGSIGAVPIGLGMARWGAGIGSGEVDYAGYVEYGTYKMGARPFVRQSVNAASAAL